MPTVHTLYKGNASIGNIYSSELNAWLDDGWSKYPSESKAKMVVDSNIINLSTATKSEIKSLKGVGDTTAEGVIKLRGENVLSLDLLEKEYPKIEWELLNIEFE